MTPREGGPTVIKFKSCPKCSGDLYLNRDCYGSYLNCFQRGYIKDLDSLENPVTKKPVPVAAEAMDLPLAA